MINAAAAACRQTDPQAGTISTGLMQYSIMSPGAASTTLVIVLANSICFLDATIHSFSTTGRKTRVCLIHLQKMTMDSSANSTWDQCWWFQLWGPVCHHAAAAELVRRHSRTLVRISNYYKTFLYHADKREGVQLTWSAPTWHWM